MLCHGVRTLLIEKFADGEASVGARASEELVLVEVRSDEYQLSRETAAQLRDALADALTRTDEFVHTRGRHRRDGRYVVERRGADSSGHRKVFSSFGDCRRVYEGLSREFSAADVDHEGLTGRRRHLLVRHFAEHPAFDCELVSRQPLTARKTSAEDGSGEPERRAAVD